MKQDVEYSEEFTGDIITWKCKNDDPEDGDDLTVDPDNEETPEEKG